MDVDLLRREDIPAELAPVAQGEDREVFVRLYDTLVPSLRHQRGRSTYIYTLLAQARKDGVRASADSPVLTLQNEPHGRRVCMIQREGVSWQQWDDYTAPPLRTLVVGANDPVHDGVADLVLDLHFVHDRSRQAEASEIQ